MFKQLLGAIGIGVGAARSAATAQLFKPYVTAPAANAIYRLLFCDDLPAFRPEASAKPAEWQELLFDSQDPSKIEALGNNPSAESRIRALAYNWLRAHGHETPRGIILGVIIEVPMDSGLDVLAAYSDGTVRYINQSGGMAIIEPGTLPEVNSEAKRLVELSQPVVARIGPWDKPRLPPPVKPNLRLSFVVSDGLYFGQGPSTVMQHDALAGPVIQQGAQLLKLVTDETAAKPDP
jgi:hypothetical protein